MGKIKDFFKKASGKIKELNRQMEENPAGSKENRKFSNRIRYTIAFIFSYMIFFKMFGKNITSALSRAGGADGIFLIMIIPPVFIFSIYPLVALRKNIKANKFKTGSIIFLIINLFFTLGFLSLLLKGLLFL